MDWHDVADLPFASALTPHTGGLAAHTDYDGEHFDQLSFDDPQAPSSHFIECAFTCTGSRSAAASSTRSASAAPR